MKNFKSEENCIICGNFDSCYHHIRSRKSHPELKFDERNLMSLCLLHHVEVHKIGTNTFIKKYNLESYMKNKGWDHDKFLNKWYLINH
jgi:hypothetical protein